MVVVIWVDPAGFLHLGKLDVDGVEDPDPVSEIALYAVGVAEGLREDWE